MSVLPQDKYRGAVVEDLQLPPAFSLPADESIFRAIDLAYERDFSHIPVLDKNRRPLGYVDVAALKAKWQAGIARPGDSVIKYMTKFIRTESHPYTVITPDTPLAELAEFLRNNLFALVTDVNRKFVLAVATSQDLEARVLNGLYVAATSSFSHRISFLVGAYNTQLEEHIVSQLT